MNTEAHTIKLSRDTLLVALSAIKTVLDSARRQKDEPVSMLCANALADFQEALVSDMGLHAAGEIMGALN